MLFIRSMSNEIGVDLIQYVTVTPCPYRRSSSTLAAAQMHLCILVDLTKAQFQGSPAHYCIIFIINMVSIQLNEIGKKNWIQRAKLQLGFIIIEHNPAGFFKTVVVTPGTCEMTEKYVHKLLCGHPLSILNPSHQGFKQGQGFKQQKNFNPSNSTIVVSG